MKKRYVLGVHIANHDSAVCLFEENRLICAISRERLTRIKHQGGNPIECIEYVLEATNIKKSDVDLLVRCIWHNEKIEFEEIYEQFPKVITNNNHHLFHAYSNLLTCKPLDKMLCVIWDGRGARPCDTGIYIPDIDEEFTYESESVYLYDSKLMIPLEKFFAKYIPNKYKWGTMFSSLGYAYSVISRIIFGSHHAAGKIMALASLGKENKVIPHVFSYGENKEFKVTQEWLDYIEQLEYPINYKSSLAKDLCYSIQKEVEEYSVYRLKSLFYKYNIQDFCLSGGVALNCKNNGILANQPFINSLSVFNACSDDGVAVGIAIWAIREIFNDYRKPTWNIGTGKNYQQIDLDSLDKVIDEIVEDIINGKFIGIFSNGSEFGPRALGNRTIIASATDIKYKKVLNEIKKREAFRPFGGIILKENLSKLTNEKLASLYMLTAIHIKESEAVKMPALLHNDGTTRLQIVEDDCILYRILKKYEEKTNNIVLINTSFNDKGEPIVETEEQALKCAQRIGLYAVLVHDNYKKFDIS